MAYAALVSLPQTIDQILNHQQYSISLHEKQQLISTGKYVFLLQSFLEDFPEKAKSSLEGRIRDAANEAEDVIEYVMWEQIRPRYRLIKWTVALAKVKFKYQMKKVREQFDSIAREAMDIKDSFRIKDVRLGVSPAHSSSSRPAPTCKNDMVGFNDDLLAIKSRLCGESSKRQIIPIFGMGGIGKTTLARNAYNDPLTMEYFQIRAWVTVSQDYSTHQILSSLQVSMKVFNVERSGQSNESMAEKVYKSLKGRRYLIVMDDLWSTKVWDDIKMIFPDDNNGSRIILTTRLSVVAAYADSFSPLHEMRFMDVDQSWNLLRQKMIARSCRGLPLAIVVIAGLLSRVSQTKASWENIAENVNLAVTENNEQFDKVFSLSYTHLPHHLRPYYEIHVSKLIKLWIAEGFMEPNVSKSFEETAEEYLEDLVKRSLVLVTKRKFNGKIKSCNVHDLVRDLCIRKAQEEKFLLHVMDRCVRKVLLKSIKNHRRISIAQSDISCSAKIYGSSIRTIICLQGRAISLRSLGNFRLLRVLDVVHNYVNPLPAEVFELLHLRYLALGNLMRIPAAISNLQNLQTLIIYSGEVYLPLEIWEMPQLRHLVCSFDHLPFPEGATFVLENLQTLSVAANFKFTKRILKMIPNLKHLGICYYAYEFRV
ncbi:hypothetical protein Pfo_015487 [Paulownia fortunei]|nr:hypothetical protein Pfo_015487 [Paulownia fortunei]